MKRSSLLKWTLGGAVAAVVGTSAITFAYLQLFKTDPPPPASFDSFDTIVETTLESKLETASDTAAQSTCKTIKFENGVTVKISKPVGGHDVVGTTNGASGEIVVCPDQLPTGTIDVDVSSLSPGEGSTADQVAAMRSALLADEFPVLTVVLGQPALTAIGEGEQLEVEADVELSGSEVGSVSVRFAA